MFTPLCFYLQSWSSVWFDIFIFSFVTISSVTLSRKHSKMLYKISYCGFQILKFRTPNFTTIKRNAPPRWLFRSNSEWGGRTKTIIEKTHPTLANYRHADLVETDNIEIRDSLMIRVRLRHIDSIITNHIDTLRPFLGRLSVIWARWSQGVSALRVQTAEKCLSITNRITAGYQIPPTGRECGAENPFLNK